MSTKNPASVMISVVLVIVVLAVLAYLFARKPEVAVAPVPTGTVEPAPAYSGDTANLVSVSLAPGQEVSGSFALSGTIKGAYFFEANMIVQVLDAAKNVLRTSPGTATTDWMTSEPVSFTATVDVTGIAPGKGYIRLHNDNPSGMPENDRFIDIPVVFR